MPRGRWRKHRLVGWLGPAMFAPLCRCGLATMQAAESESTDLRLTVLLTLHDRMTGRIFGSFSTSVSPWSERPQLNSMAGWLSLSAIT